MNVMLYLCTALHALNLSDPDVANPVDMKTYVCIDHTICHKLGYLNIEAGIGPSQRPRSRAILKIIGGLVLH